MKRFLLSLLVTLFLTPLFTSCAGNSDPAPAPDPKQYTLEVGVSLDIFPNPYGNPAFFGVVERDRITPILLDRRGTSFSAEDGDVWAVGFTQSTMVSLLFEKITYRNSHTGALFFEKQNPFGNGLHIAVEPGGDRS